MEILWNPTGASNSLAIQCRVINSTSHEQILADDQESMWAGKKLSDELKDKRE